MVSSCLPLTHYIGSPFVNQREEFALEDDILFFGLLAAAVITSLVIGRLWKENDGRLLMALVVVDGVLILGLIAARDKASEGNFAKAERVLREGTHMDLVWKDSSDEKRVHAVVQNSQTKRRQAVIFGENPPSKFTVGKVRGWFKWKRLELKPAKEDP